MLYHLELQIKCQILIFKVAKLYSHIYKLQIAYTLIINLGLTVTLFFNNIAKHFSKEEKVRLSLTSVIIIFNLRRAKWEVCWLFLRSRL